MPVEMKVVYVTGLTTARNSPRDIADRLASKKKSPGASGRG